MRHAMYGAGYTLGTGALALAGAFGGPLARSVALALAATFGGLFYFQSDTPGSRDVFRMGIVGSVAGVGLSVLLPVVVIVWTIGVPFGVALWFVSLPLFFAWGEIIVSALCGLFVVGLCTTFV